MAEGTGPHVAVVGASFAGLFAAAAASAAGCRTTLLERDELPEEARPRPGVPQGAQSHVLIHGGLLAAGRLLPGLRQDLLARGAVPVDTGRLPWLGEHGWWPQGDHGYEVLCLSRPALEEVVRRRVLQLPGVRLRTGTRVAGLHPAHGSGWCLDVAGGEPLGADVVVDASGRGSRLPRWLAALGLPAARVETVDARIGYASRRYAGTGGTAVVLPALPGVGRGGNALPLEDGQWLVSAVGAGEQRPPRDVEGFLAFLASLADPVLHEQALRWEPLGDVAVHRQTANVRHHHESVPGWPAGLLAVGDALCAFDPVYGQGIAVAARQALVLGSRLARPLTARTTRRLQRRLAAVADLPWAIATGEDLRFPSTGGRQGPAQAALSSWAAQVGRLGAAGDLRAARTLLRAYHLVGSPVELVHPALVAAVLRARLRGHAPPVPRPAVLARATSAARP